jgi:hypothetical protein
LPATRVPTALVALAQRYARELHLGAKDFAEALQAARSALASGATASAAQREIRSSPSAEPAQAEPPPSDFAKTLAARKGGAGTEKTAPS